MISHRLGVASAVFFALVVSVPSAAMAHHAATYQYEGAETVEELNRFVTEWTAALLGNDVSVFDDLRAQYDFDLWREEFRIAAIEELYASVDAQRPADVAALTEAAAITQVKAMLALFVFDPEGAEMTETMPTPEQYVTIENASLGTPPGVDTSAELNAEILAAGIPHAVALQGALARGAVTTETPTLRQLVESGVLDGFLSGDKVEPPAVPELPVEPPATPDPAAAAEAVKAMVNPVLEQASTFVPVAGTYTLVVTAADGTVTELENLPFGAIVPVDADFDGTTGPGGVDFFAGVVLDAAPGATAATDGTDASASVSNVAPALVVKRAFHTEGPDFLAYEKVLVQAFISMNGGLSLAHVGVDARENGMPQDMTVAFFVNVDAESTTATSLVDLASGIPDMVNSDARSLADSIAAKGGVTIPWSDIDGLDEEAVTTIADAQAEIAAQLAAVQGEIAAKRAEIEAQLAPVNQAAEDAQATAERLAAPYEAYASDRVEDATELAESTQSAAEAAAAPAVTAVNGQIAAANQLASDTQGDVAESIGDAMAAAEPYREYVDGLLTYVSNTAAGPMGTVSAAAEQAQEDANAQVTTLQQDLVDPTVATLSAEAAARKADVFAAAVAANIAAGTQRNEAAALAFATADELQGMLGPMPAAKIQLLQALPGDIPPEAQPVADAVAEAQALAAPLAGDAQATADAAAATLGETSAAPGDAFTLQVRTIAPEGEVALVGGILNFDANQVLTDYTLLTMAIASPPTTLNLSVEKTDGVTVLLESSEPTELAALVVRDEIGGRADVALLTTTPLPKSLALDFQGTKYGYEATNVLGTLTVDRLAFRSHADFVAWLASPSTLSAKILSITATDIPAGFEAVVDRATASYDATSRMGSLEFIQLRLTGGRLSDDLVRFYFGGIPSSFDVTTGKGGSAFGFYANGPLSVIEVERTNGPRLAGYPNEAFAVLYNRNGGELAHLRLLNIVSVVGGTGAGGTLFEAYLQGGYDFYVLATAGDVNVVGVLGEMPNHIRAWMANGNGMNLDLTMEPASSRGIYAAASLPHLGGKTAVLSVSNLPSRMVFNVDTRVPSFSYSATARIAGIAVNVVGPSGNLMAYLGFYDIPTAFYLGMTKHGNGMPNTGYAASESTLRIRAGIDGDAMGVFPGHAYLDIGRISYAGLFFGQAGQGFTVYSPGDRLGWLYLDVGYRFSGSSSQWNHFVNDWWLDAGAGYSLYYFVNIVNFNLYLGNVRYIDFQASVPQLRVYADGVFQTWFNIHLDASLYARAWAYLLRFIPIFDISISWGNSGPFPIYFTSWWYNWYGWVFTLLVLPWICGVSWWGIRWGTWHWHVGVYLRLPGGFYHSVNGFSVAYGTIEPFVNPGGIIPYWMIYTYALIKGFSVSANSWTEAHC